MSPAREYRHKVRVYYEDTDCMGLVYHASYLRFIERARSEIVAATGPSVAAWEEKGILFPVYRIEVFFRGPARLWDDLEVVTSVALSSQYRLRFTQRIVRAADAKKILDAEVDVVCTDLSGELRTVPELPGLELE
jgi:acyl-CoA thioester hydrolase